MVFFQLQRHLRSSSWKEKFIYIWTFCYFYRNLSDLFWKKWQKLRSCKTKNKCVLREIQLWIHHFLPKYPFHFRLNLLQAVNLWANFQICIRGQCLEIHGQFTSLQLKWEIVKKSGLKFRSVFNSTWRVHNLYFCVSSGIKH